jgi:hypothetical protein
MEDIDKKAKLLRWLFEFLFCVYSTLLYVAVREGVDPLINKIWSWFETLDRFFVARFHLSLFGIHSTDPQLFNEVWLALATLAFVCVRLLGQFRAIGRWTPLIWVCLTVAGPLYYPFFASDEWRLAPRVWWMRFEVAAMIAVLLGYAYRRSIVSTSLCVAAVLAHFWLWGWIMGSEPDYHYTPLSMAKHVLLPLCIVLVWGAYSRMVSASVPWRQIFAGRKNRTI